MKAWRRDNSGRIESYTPPPLSPLINNIDNSEFDIPTASMNMNNEDPNLVGPDFVNHNQGNNNNMNNIARNGNPIPGNLNDQVGQGIPLIPQDPQERTLRELLLPERNATPSCIVLPPRSGTFHFRNGMIQLLPTFRGLESEQPYLHVREFDEVCATFDEPQCTEELIRLKLFPFSLKDKAKTWLLSLRSGSITSWREMQVQFLKRFFPTHITNGYKK